MDMRWIAMAAVLGMAGCASHAPVPVGDGRAQVRVEGAGPGSATATSAVKPTALAGIFYTVKKGDTLHGIALDHGVDYRELAAWNNIENINRIKVGQQLRVNAPGVGVATAPAVADPGVAEVKPIAISGGVVSRSLDSPPAASGVPAAAVAPAPSMVSADTETLKRSPRGGKLPYSEENLARLKAQEVSAASAAAPAAPVTASPVEKTPDKPAVAAPAAAPVAVPAGEGEIEWQWPITGKLLATFSEGGSGQEASKGVDIGGKIGDPVLAAAVGKVVYVGSGLRGYGNLVIVRHNAAFLSAYAHNSRILVKEGQAVTRGQKIAELGNSDADQPKLHFEVRQQGKPVDPLKFLPAR